WPHLSHRAGPRPGADPRRVAPRLSLPTKLLISDRSTHGTCPENGAKRWTDDVTRVAGHARDFRAVDEFDRIGAARVLRNLGIGEVDGPVLLEHHVLEHGAEAQRLENVRLALRRQVD